MCQWDILTEESLTFNAINVNVNLNQIKSDEQEWNLSWVDQLVWLAEQLFFREHGTNENLTHTGW